GGGEPQQVGPGERSENGEGGGDDHPIAPQHGLDSRVRHVGLAHDAALAEMDLGELAVGVGKLQPNRPRGLGPTASDLGKRVFETIDHLDAHPVLRPGHRPRPSVTPGTTKRALRPEMSTWNSMGAKIGSCNFSNVDANTLKTVLPGAVS